MPVCAESDCLIIGKQEVVVVSTISAVTAPPAPNTNTNNFKVFICNVFNAPVGSRRICERTTSLPTSEST